ncbi:hypothetical protein IEQ34_014894 [Dendrobium chrysotoxum]|uniref:Uncharacterized protein n=1 Tax=Dendrobium chrysotoxum TaxID=161865 RepID=A0AAV7GL63_DENCH|nr:hypothetical protein IEQ34_014894 [Dendrobium chrysotoxum]
MKGKKSEGHGRSLFYEYVHDRELIKREKTSCCFNLLLRVHLERGRMDAYSSDEEKIEQPKSEVEIHLEVRKDAFARYMDMLLDRAFEILEEKDDPQEEEEDD